MIGLDLKRPKTLLKRIETIEIHIGQTGILQGDLEKWLGLT